MSYSMVRLALVASVACTAPAGQPPQQPGVDGAEGEPAGLGGGARAVHVVEQPGQLGGGEIGVEQQAGAFGDQRLVAGGAQRGAGGGGAAVLPDDGLWIGRPVARSQTRVVSRWLVMPMAATSAAPPPACGQRLAQGLDAVREDLLGVVFHPARGREMLRQVAPRGGRRASCGARKAMVRVDVVPWSRARIRSRGMERSPWPAASPLTRVRASEAGGSAVRPAKRSVNQPKNVCAPRRRAARSLSGPISAMASPVMSRSEAMAAIRRRMSFSHASSSMQK